VVFRLNLPATRALRDVIFAEDQTAGPLITALSGRLKARFNRNAIPRPDMLAGVEQAWREHLPPRSRLALAIDLNLHRKSLTISEMRLTASTYLPEAWDAAELGLIVNMLGLEARRLLYRFDVHTLAHVGAHALARRFQRGLDDSETEVLQDLRALGEAAHALADGEEGSDFVVPCAGGAWRGCVALLTGRAGRRGD
jgi:hypothetical protein